MGLGTVRVQVPLGRRYIGTGDTNMGAPQMDRRVDYFFTNSIPRIIISVRRYRERNNVQTEEADNFRKVIQTYGIPTTTIFLTLNIQKIIF